MSAWLPWLAIPVVCLLLLRIDRVQRWYWINLRRIDLRSGHLCLACPSVVGPLPGRPGSAPAPSPDAVERCRLGVLYDDVSAELARRHVRSWWWLTTELHWPREQRILPVMSERLGRTVTADDLDRVPVI